VLPGGHFLLEFHLDDVATRIHDFLATAIGR
jgi:surfactin synthase thioesterase subunit